MVKLAKSSSSQVAATTGGRKRNVVAIVANCPAVLMQVPCKYGVVALAKKFFHLKPVGIDIPMGPKRLMEQYHSPTSVRLLCQYRANEAHLICLLPGPGNRRIRPPHHSKQLRVQNQKEYPFVAKVIITRSKTPLPFFSHHCVVHIVIAGGIEERCVQLCNGGFNIIPLSLQLLLIFCVTFNQVANADHKRRSQQVHFWHRGCKHSSTRAACAIADNGKVKIIWRVVNRLLCPGCRTGELGQLQGTCWLCNICCLSAGAQQHHGIEYNSAKIGRRRRGDPPIDNPVHQNISL